ncbi:MAG: hypothetical protein J6V23_00140 [Bacteroidaceae bacterium]|nr:hypothetical protein [Bacteroidaceae bacterium]
MIPKKKKKYTEPAVWVIEITGCNMVCASIFIDDNEVNTGGRAAEHKNSWQDIWEYME